MYESRYAVIWLMKLMYLLIELMYADERAIGSQPRDDAHGRLAYVNHFGTGLMIDMTSIAFIRFVLAPTSFCSTHGGTRRGVHKRDTKL